MYSRTSMKACHWAVNLITNIFFHRKRTTNVFLILELGPYPSIEYILVLDLVLTFYWISIYEQSPR